MLVSSADYSTDTGRAFNPGFGSVNLQRPAERGQLGGGGGAAPAHRLHLVGQARARHVVAHVEIESKVCVQFQSGSNLIVNYQALKSGAFNWVQPAPPFRQVHERIRVVAAQVAIETSVSKRSITF